MRTIGQWLLSLFLVAGVAAAAANDRRDLDAVQQLRVENLALKSQLARAIAETDACRVELAPLRTRINAAALREETARLKKDLEAAHPGFTWNPQTGHLEPTPEGRTP